VEAELMPLDESELDLHRRARERIREGRLPCTTHYRTWAGHGRDEPCALCDVNIGADEVEYEIETLDAPGVHLFRFHFRCHDAWHYACAEPS
jgi:hypothetical protein